MQNLKSDHHILGRVFGRLFKLSGKGTYGVWAMERISTSEMTHGFQAVHRGRLLLQEAI
jgi:hypothetical protein